MTLLPVAAADQCPVCRADHQALDEFWACPRHGHQLQFRAAAGGMERFTCPAHRCPYQRLAPPRPRNLTNGDPMTAIATRPSTAVDAMWARKPHLDAVLPSHIDVKSFIGTAAAALYANPDLMKAAETSPDTLMIALMECASLGHRPGTEEYYLTPRKKKGRPVVLGIEGYRGVIERMYRSGAVATVIVREVCARDYFKYTEGEDLKPIHKFTASEGTTGADFFGANGSVNRGPMVGVYAYAVMTTGAVSRVVLASRDDVFAARAEGGWRADDPYSPWNRYDAGPDHPELQGRSMWWKTGALRLEPWVPTSAEYRREQLRAAAQAAPAAAAAPTWLPSPDELNDITDAEVVSEPDAIVASRATSGQQSQIRALFKGIGFEDHADDQLEVLAILGKFTGVEDLDGPGQLTQDQAAVVIGHLKACKGSRPALYELLTEAGDE